MGGDCKERSLRIEKERKRDKNKAYDLVIDTGMALAARGEQEGG